MISLSMQYTKLYTLKLQQQWSYYYKLEESKYGRPCIVNRINTKPGSELSYRDDKLCDKRNKWLGFTNLLFVSQNDPEKFELVLIHKSEPTQCVYMKKNLDADECLTWMKLFYSVSRILYRECEGFKTTTELRATPKWRQMHDWLKGKNELFQELKKFDDPNYMSHITLAAQEAARMANEK